MLHHIQLLHHETIMILINVKKIAFGNKEHTTD